MRFRKNKENHSESESRTSRFKKRLSRDDQTELPTDSRVTNSTLEHHRQAVISRGKRFKYPFYHSRHRVVIISSIVLLVALILFLAFSITKLYRYRPYDDFSYALTEIIPFPVAKVDDHLVTYRQYLFELRSTTFSMTHDFNVDFSTTDGKKMLSSYQRQALTSAETYAYAKKVAAEKGIVVTPDEVNQTLEIIKKHSLNSASSSNKSVDQSIFDRTIKEKYDWTEGDLRSSITELLYKEKVAAALDTTATSKADSAVKDLSKKKSFSDVAKKYSDDDATKNRGGILGMVTQDGSLVDGGTSTKTTLPDIVVQTVFSLKQGQTSGIIKAPEALYIVKNLKTDGNKRQLAYIQISYKDLSQYVNDLRSKGKIKEYITLPNTSNATDQAG
jgi:hypothetical protein